MTRNPCEIFGSVLATIIGFSFIIISTQTFLFDDQEKAAVLLVLGILIVIVALKLFYDNMYEMFAYPDEETRPIILTSINYTAVPE